MSSRRRAARQRHRQSAGSRRQGVAIGKLQGWGLAAGGKDALVRTSCEILEEEIIASMGLLGVTNVNEITPNHVCAVDPVAPAHEMSAWPNLPGSRLL